MMVFNSFTATNDYNFGKQRIQWPSHFPANKKKLLKAFVWLLWGNFFRGSYETSLLKTIYLILSLFMNMSAKKVNTRLNLYL